ncbi:MAG: nucleotidyltransferase [Ignavibacteriae bacterium]|nr:nucleotidyltransferase [Ignavibacteriota bacterium]
MLTLEAKTQFGELLEKSIEKLDISDAQFEAATERYKAVGEWLGGEESPLAKFEPEIRPQGSFRFGTVIKPWDRDDEFDLDFTFKLQKLSKLYITQKELKNLVGDRLKDEKSRYKNMLGKEKRRCWTVEYADGTGFHMDIVPAISDDYEWLLALGVPEDIAKHAVCITDKKTWNNGNDWPKSNPEGYALWFTDRMKTRYIVIEAAMRKALQLDKVPAHKIKTPLQRSIQLLKRHRDWMFGDDENKPASIIITTLAALAYNNEEHLYDALSGILSKMNDARFIRTEGGLYVIENPVNPRRNGHEGENFADKWNENREKAINFFQWLEAARKYFLSFTEMRGLPVLAKSLQPVIGERYVNESLDEIANAQRHSRESGLLKMSAGTGTLGSVGRAPVKNHTFHGNDE